MTITITADPHPWATELHPEWCASGPGCGIHTSTIGEFVAAATPGDADAPVVLLSAAMDTDDRRWIEVVASNADADIEMRFDVDTAAALAAALAARVALARAAARMEHHDVDGWLASLAGQAAA